ncbi:MAG: hypothetical protein J6R79_06720 [Bacteroidaceae bacterium]|nr:hypothetical protein [Bacteroidaceae bacterium]
MELLQENELFLGQIEALERQIVQGEDYKKKYEQLQKDHERLCKEYGKLKAILVQQKPSSDANANKPDVQNMIEAIVEFGESYPSNQNDKADVIRQLLAEDVFKEAGLTKDIKKRIKKIGRKEPNANMNINTKSMFDISGNNNVNIGNHEH